MNQIQKITSLVQELNEHRNAYYNLNAPTITDKEYDQLFDELQQLETETGFILSNSPTQTVGYYPVSSLSKVQHPVPLLSLEKTKQVTEITALLARNPALLMLKLDGLTTKLVYEDGHLYWGLKQELFHPEWLTLTFIYTKKGKKQNEKIINGKCHSHRVE